MSSKHLFGLDFIQVSYLQDIYVTLVVFYDQNVIPFIIVEIIAFEEFEFD